MERMARVEGLDCTDLSLDWIEMASRLELDCWNGIEAGFSFLCFDLFTVFSLGNICAIVRRSLLRLETIIAEKRLCVFLVMVRVKSPRKTVKTYLFRSNV